MMKNTTHLPELIFTIVIIVLGILFIHFVATSDLPFWVKYILLK